MKDSIALTEMRQGQKGVIRDLVGGRTAKQRLSSMGIRPGQEVTKTSGPFMRGPVTVRVGNAQMALGFGMAGKVMVEVESNGNE